MNGTYTIQLRQFSFCILRRYVPRIQGYWILNQWYGIVWTTNILQNFIYVHDYWPIFLQLERIQERFMRNIVFLNGISRRKLFFLYEAIDTFPNKSRGETENWLELKLVPGYLKSSNGYFYEGVHSVLLLLIQCMKIWG